MPSANTFKYQTIWTKECQKSNWAMPVHPVIADLPFKADLQIGDTVKRRYRTNPIFANDLGSDGSYTVQYYVEGQESFQISKQKEATVRIVKPTVLHTDLDVTKSYGVQLSNAIWQDIEGGRHAGGMYLRRTSSVRRRVASPVSDPRPNSLCSLTGAPGRMFGGLLCAARREPFLRQNILSAGQHWRRICARASHAQAPEKL
jgi:hypothetical protein